MELKKYNLGKPTSFKPTKKYGKVNKDIPQAWEHNWNCYYNWKWAVLEAKALWKKTI